jgi:uncharacterized protein
MTDVALEIGDEERIAAVRRWWQALMDSSVYLTGAVGGRWTAEAVGEPYELPQSRGYTETCGAVAAAQWHLRILQLDGQAEAADALERVTHNALLAGPSLRGDEWFYATPHATTCRGEEHPWIGETMPTDIAGPLPLRRRPWRDVTCCPPNALRALATMPSNWFGVSDDTLWVNAYAPARVRVADWDVQVETDLPWGSTARLVVLAGPSREASLCVRKPSWSGETGYEQIRRRFHTGETIDLDFGVRARAVVASQRVESLRGAVAIERGPITWCFEGIDNPSIGDLRDLAVDPAGVPEWHFAEPIEGTAIPTLAGSAAVLDPAPLYGPYGRALNCRAVDARAIPFFAFGNRGETPMLQWVAAAGPDALSTESANRARSTVEA